MEIKNCTWLPATTGAPIPDLVDLTDIQHCPKSRDGYGHCDHWWYGETPCCWCGDNTPRDNVAEPVAEQDKKAPR